MRQLDIPWIVIQLKVLEKRARIPRRWAGMGILIMAILYLATSLLIEIAFLTVFWIARINCGCFTAPIEWPAVLDILNLLTAVAIASAGYMAWVDRFEGYTLGITSLALALLETLATILHGDVNFLPGLQQTLFVAILLYIFVRSTTKPPPYEGHTG